MSMVLRSDFRAWYRPIQLESYSVVRPKGTFSDRPSFRSLVRLYMMLNSGSTAEMAALPWLEGPEMVFRFAPVTGALKKPRPCSTGVREALAFSNLALRPT